MNNRIWYWFNLAVTLVAIAYFISYASEHIDSLTFQHWGLENWLLLILTSVFAACVIGIGVIIWHGLLADMQSPLSWIECFTIFSYSQFAKYLPGNFAHHIGRVVLAKNAGVPTGIVLRSMLLETAWSIAVATGIALLALPLLLKENLVADGGNVNGPILFAIFIAALILPSTLVWILNALTPRLTKKLSGQDKLALPSTAMMVRASLLFLLAFCVFGLVLDLHARHLFGSENGNIIVLTGIFSWAWIAGYLTPGAPAGLGIREVVLISTLSPIYGSSIAVSMSISLRLVTTLGDGLVFLLGIIADRVVRKK